MADTHPLRRTTRSSLLFLTLCLLSPIAAAAQTEVTAGLHGTITCESNGAPLAGARVVVRNLPSRVERTTTTDETGNFAVNGLPPGDAYEVTVSADNFRPLRRAQLKLVSAVSLDVSLALELAGVAETVEITDAVAPVVSDAPEISQVVEPRRLAELPVNGRSLNRFALLDPHARNTGGTGGDGSTAQRLSINASSYRLTFYKLDGNSNYDFVFANAPQQQVSLSSVAEFKVLTNQYAAEYGGSSAGIVSAVTKAGTSAYHGEAFFFLRPSGLQAAPPVSTRHVPNEAAQFGGALGGPLFGERLTFFMSYERARQNRGAFIQSPAPLTHTGHFRDQLGLARIDYQRSQTHTITLRLNGNRNTNDNANDRVSGFTQPSAAQGARAQSVGAQLTDRTVWGATVNELRASYVNALPSVSAALAPQVAVVRPNYSTAGGSAYSWVRTETLQLADQLAVLRGAHELKFGADYTRQRVNDFSYNAFGEYQFAPGAPRPNEQPITYTQKFGTGFVRYGQTLASAFAQDNWKLTPRLTANLGLRYDYQSSTSDRNNFAPRLGFAWDVRGDGKTILRGGAGLFYDQYYMYITRRFLLEGIDAKIRTYKFDYARAGVPGSATTPGAPTFPDSLTDVPAGASEAIRDYVYLPAAQLLNPYSAQFSLGFQRTLGGDWTLTADVIHQRTLKQQRVNDINAPAPFARTAPGQTRSAAAADATRPFGTTYQGVRVRKVAVIENTASSTYDALDVGLVRRLSRRLQFEAHYVYASAMTDAMFFGEADTGIPDQFRTAGRGEWGPSDFHQRHRLVAHGLVSLPHDAQLSFVATLASGLPVNPVTGLDDNGDGYKSDRPVGLGRNSFRTPAHSSFDTSFAKRFSLREGLKLELRGEAFNLFNHANHIKLNNIYGNAAAPAPTFLTPLAGVQNVEPGRQFQFGARLVF